MLKLSTPEISSFNRGTGSTEIGELVFETAILSVMEFYGVQWRSLQITELAQMMHSKYYWLHLAELKQFTLKAKSGDYNRKSWIKGAKGEMEEYDGKIYGDLKPAVLMKWMEEYAGESLATRGDMRIENAKPPKALPPAKEADQSKWIGEEKAMAALMDFSEQFAKTQGWQTEESIEMLDAERDKLRKWEAENAIRIKCRIVAEAIVSGAKEAMLPQYRQIQANYPGLVEECLKELQSKPKQQQKAKP